MQETPTEEWGKSHHRAGKAAREGYVITSYHTGQPELSELIRGARELGDLYTYPVVTLRAQGSSAALEKAFR